MVKLEPRSRRAAQPAVGSRRKPLIVAGIVLLLLVAGAALLGISALRAQSALSSARGHLEVAKTALLAGNGAAATDELGQAASDTAAGRSATEGVAWNLAAAVPYLGRHFATTSDRVVQVLQPVAKAGVPLSLSRSCVPRATGSTWLGWWPHGRRWRRRRLRRRP